MTHAVGVFDISETVKNASDIIDVAAGSKDHTTLVAAVKAAGLVETLKGAGPFTAFEMITCNYSSPL
jgi:uncharacterized surface protein with fasciclin (FAS1) repeats